LQIYQQEFIPKRIVECHSNIALTQFQFGNFKAAADHYRNAFVIGSNLDNEILRYTTEFNYGYSYFLIQQYEESIEHIENSMKFIPAEYTSDLLMCFCLLIKSNIELKNFDEAQKWVSKGLTIVESKKLNLDSPTNNAFKEAYIEFMCLVYLVKEKFSEFEKLVLQKLIPSFKMNKDRKST